MPYLMAADPQLAMKHGKLMIAVTLFFIVSFVSIQSKFTNFPQWDNRCIVLKIDFKGYFFRCLQNIHSSYVLKVTKFHLKFEISVPTVTS